MPFGKICPPRTEEMNKAPFGLKFVLNGGEWIPGVDRAVSNCYACPWKGTGLTRMTPSPRRRREKCLFPGGPPL
jgi:hypothetical protein